MTSFSRRKSQQRYLWFERVMALLATANLGLVLFDMTYIPWRDFWLRGVIQAGGVTLTLPLPPITQWYDPIKGIEPHRETQTYLTAVDQLQEDLQRGGINSPQAQKSLQELRDRSRDMIDTNPFSAANKSGTLEKIKNRMREHIYGSLTRDQSSREAFKQFWSQDYLSQQGINEQLKFFNERIRPLIATNYFRSIGEDGQPTDWFVLLDAPFAAIFGLEFLLRTFLLSRRYKSLTWIDAMVWRWYDVFLFLPFARWLRVIPVAVRLDQAQLVNLDRVREQATQGFVASIAEELTEAVLAQSITRLQMGLQQGDVAQRLLRTLDKPYVDLNQRDEVKEIVSQLLTLTVYQVLPKIRPEIEAVLRHPIEAVLTQAPGYDLLKSVPILGGVPNQVNHRLVSTATEQAYNALVMALEDKMAAELMSQLVKTFGKTLVEELQQGRTLEEVQSLLNDLLEEVKVNYVDALMREEIEITLNQPGPLRRISGQSS
jgi:hypothetical protein